MNSLPPHARGLWTFNSLNAINFTIAMGSPLVLTARFLGAGEGLLGFLIALTPFFAVLQLPAARYADRFGYRTLVFAGWRARAVILLLAAPLPLFVGRAPALALLTVFTFLMVAFNAIRGFASGSWLPWLKQVIPAEQVGRYFSIESFLMNLAILSTLLVSGWFLGHSPPAWHYTALFAAAGLVGLGSVLPLRRVPEARGLQTPDLRIKSLEWVKTIWRNSEFRHAVRWGSFNSAVLTATPGFVVLYLKEVNGLSAGTVVGLTSLAPLGAMLAAVMLRGHLDRVGSRPVLITAAIGFFSIYAFWFLHASLGCPPSLAILAPFFFCSGLINNAAGLAGGRLALRVCPHENATLAMAFWQVIQAVGSAVFAVAWGYVLEALRAAPAFGQSSRAPFVIYFGCTLVFMSISAILLRRVREPVGE